MASIYAAYESSPKDLEDCMEEIYLAMHRARPQP